MLRSKCGVVAAITFRGPPPRRHARPAGSPSRARTIGECLQAACSCPRAPRCPRCPLSKRAEEWGELRQIEEARQLREGFEARDALDEEELRAEMFGCMMSADRQYSALIQDYWEAEADFYSTWVDIARLRLYAQFLRNKKVN